MYAFVALGVCEFVHAIALLVMQNQRVYGFVPRSSRRSSDETNGPLPNDKLILYC